MIGKLRGKMPEKLSQSDIAVSQIDKKILKILLSPTNGPRSSKSISVKLGIPVTTVRRRRKRLEKKFLKLQYILDIEKFG